MRWIYLATAVVVAIFATLAIILGLVGLPELVQGNAFGKDVIFTPLLIVLGGLSFRAAWALWRRSSKSAVQWSSK